MSLLDVIFMLCYVMLFIESIICFDTNTYLFLH